jgi:hypothetical protein
MRLAGRLLLCAAFPVLCVESQGASLIASSLYSATQWAQLCASSGKDTQHCLISLSRPSDQGGRSGDAFVIATPASNDQLQTRSGVYLTPLFNKKITTVDDDPKRTVIRMKSGLECFTYSAHASLMHEMGDKSIDSFVRYSADDRTASATKTGKIWITGKPAILFEKKGGGLQGVYIHDPDANAGIWAACKMQPNFKNTGKTSPLVQEFFSSITGSAKFFY